MALDLLITNGLIIDGSGNPGFYGSVAITGDDIRVLRGDVGQLEPARTIDATGKIVCPGFIDMHAHSGLVRRQLLPTISLGGRPTPH